MELQFTVKLVLTLVTSMLLCFLATPAVKLLANRVGAIDVPTEQRRVHTQPIPRLGGLALFLGFVISVLLFADVTVQVRGMLIGTLIMVVVGAVDDVHPLRALVKLVFQIAAAVVAVLHDVIIRFISNPNLFSETQHVPLGGVVAIVITVFWIVGITNSVNLIDGLDGLAAGVSAIASIAMFCVALLAGEGNVALILIALAGACIGFLPYNLNPAKIFMGDTGALMLGYVMATVSIVGFLKFYAIISVFVPILALGLPLFDTAFAFIRRLRKGQNPLKPDRGHLHHRLLDMGFTQKQAVAILYILSAALGALAVALSSSGQVRNIVLIICAAVVFLLGRLLLRRVRRNRSAGDATPPTEPTDPDA